MQCQSYLPVRHSHYDLNGDANGGARPLYNGNGALRNRHCSNYVSSSPVPQGPLAYGKDFLRQTMLVQEVTFRDQVQELHRLYRRQKELMSEIRNKELFMNHLHLEGQYSNSFPTRFSPKCDQNSQHNLQSVNSHFHPSTIGTGNVQTCVNSFQEQKSVSATVSKGGSILNNFLEPKGKKIRGKLLDLELPAEVYIDSEDQESLEDAQFCEAPTSASSSNKLAKFVLETDAIASSGNKLFDLTIAQTNCNLSDLNEPSTTSLLEKSDMIPENVGTNCVPEILDRSLQLVNRGNARSDGTYDTQEFHISEPYKVKHVSVGSCQGTSSSNLENTGLVIQAIPCLTNQSSLSKGAKVRRIKGLVGDKVDASSNRSPGYDAARSLKSSSCKSKLKESMISLSSVNSDCSKHVNGLNYIDLNSVVSNTEFTPFSDASRKKTVTEVDRDGKNAQFSETGLSQISVLHQDVNSVDVEATRNIKKCRLIDINLPCDPITVDEPLIENDLDRLDYKNSSQINLCTNDDGLPLKSSNSDRISIEIDLEAPLSPEVEEGPSPRGDSEENQPKVTHQVRLQGESGDPLVELEKVAAESIVSMSLSKSKPYPDNQALQKSEPSDTSTLEWLADFIHAMSIDLKTDLETLSQNPTCGLDDYEAMTLNLTEMKMEEHWCQNSVSVESLTGSMSQPGQMRKGRTRRSKRKDFQREVLPSLASLSRYEVTEDIQMIEGLMEAAGTPWQLSRTRRACRMGRKPRATEQQTSTFDVLDLKNDGVFVSWGKVPRRARGHRSPASPSKWLEPLI